MRSISDTGNTKMVLKTDGEPALVQVQDQIICVRTQSTIPENRSRMTHTQVEELRGVQEVEGQLRATRLGLEARRGGEITETMASLEWMVSRASYTINRFLVSDDGLACPRGCEEVGVVKRVHTLSGGVHRLATALKVVEEVQKEVQEIMDE